MKVWHMQMSLVLWAASMGMAAENGTPAVTPLKAAKDKIKVACVQMDIPPGWFEQKKDAVDLILPHIERAGKEAVDLLVFPEYFLGYFKIPDPLTDKLCAAAKQHRVNLVAGGWESLPGFPIEQPPKKDTFCNTALVIDREGRIAGKHNKMHAAYGAESPYCWPPKPGEVSEVLMRLGDANPIVELDFGRISVLTCYDGYFFPSFEIPSLKGAEVLVWINGRAGSVEDYIVRAASFMTTTHVVSSNNSTGAGTMICAYPGQVKQITTQKGDAYIVDELDLAHLRDQRKNNRMLHQRRPDAYTDLSKEWAPWDAYPDIPFFEYPEQTNRAETGKQTAELRIRVVEENTNATTPCRMHIKDAAGNTIKAKDCPAFADHFDCDGEVLLNLPLGEYSYTIERGPEYAPVSGTFVLDAVKMAPKEIRLKRIANLAAEGWWSGDMHVHRPPEELALLMRAEDLHIAPNITWWNATNPWKTAALPEERVHSAEAHRYYDVLSGEDERNGGAFLFFNLPRPMDITQAEKEYPSPMRFLEEARSQPQAWIDLEKPFWWDAPVALALGLVDSMGIANNHMHRSGMLDNEAWGKPRDTTVFPSPWGCGLWSQHIYYQALNCGLRIPPSAGSASGVLPNPVGYNRVYVHLDEPLTWDAWWAGLRAGRCFVTNGPLLRAKANGHWPGHVFASDVPLTLDLSAMLDGNDDVPCLEIIKNGLLERTVTRQEFQQQGLGSIHFQQSGWFLLRAVTSVNSTFRFASTAPFYVEIGAEPRIIKKESIQFFMDWIEERMGRLNLDPARQEEVLQYHRKALSCWKERLSRANF